MRLLAIVPTASLLVFIVPMLGRTIEAITASTRYLT